jgi:mono/diheme cytochrome c family protein
MIRRAARLGLAAALLAGCGPRQAGVQTQPDAGQSLYLTRCALCHGENGEGIPPNYPPLAGSVWVTGSPDRMAAIILDGMQDPSRHYNGVMPAWRDTLDDAQIAAIETWVRQAAGKPPVGATDVNHVRAETAARGAPWTLDDLQRLQLH